MATKRKTKSKRAKAGQTQAKREKGRPSNYAPELCGQVTDLCKLGATDVEMAEFFDISRQTFDTWKKKHPDFLAAIKAGKIIADMQVANSLFKRATGYEQTVTKIVGKGDAARAVEVTEIVPADPASCMFWMKNRRKNEWRDKQEIEHKGALDVNLDEVRDGLQRKFDRIAGTGGAAAVAKKPV
jgi:hypothetical protein